jgi:hypothetical protein
VIVLVQGRRDRSSRDPDGGVSHANRDFIAQGAGNLASGLFENSRWAAPWARRH